MADRNPFHAASVPAAMQLARPMLTVLTAVLASGCALLPFPATPPPADPAAFEILKAKAAWQASGTDSYRWTVGRSCFCPNIDPVDVTVVNGMVTDIRTAGRPVPAGTWDASFLTVDALLDRAVETIGSGGTVEVRWSAQAGVPEIVSFDPIPNAVDDEMGISTSGFEALP